jgi:outer membrane protein assembly factor BamB
VAGLTTGPAIVANGTVWAQDQGTGDVVAVDANRGDVRARVHVGRANHFATPASGGGQLYVAAGGQLVALAE